MLALRNHIAVALFCITCTALHQVLSVHYITQCDTWLSFAESSYCGIVRKTLGALRTSPLLVAGAVLANAPGGQNREIGQ